jgi:transcriptional regulator with XRE-family HTH domain
MVRKQQGLTQRQLGEQVGLGQTYISLVERGRVPPPSMLVTAQLAGALQVPVRALLEPDTPRPDQELAEIIYLWLGLPPAARAMLLGIGQALHAQETAASVDVP